MDWSDVCHLIFHPVEWFDSWSSFFKALLILAGVILFVAGIGDSLGPVPGWAAIGAGILCLLGAGFWILKDRME